MESSNEYYQVICETCGATNRIPKHKKVEKAVCGKCKSRLASEDIVHATVIEDEIIPEDTVSQTPNPPKKKIKWKYVWMVLIGVLALWYYVDSSPGQEQALPNTGVKERHFSYSIAVAPFEVVSVSQNNHFFFKVYRVGRDAPVATFFLRGGDRIEFDLPIGRYEIKYATGQKWYGYENNQLFGSNTKLYRFEEIFHFRETYGGGYEGWTVMMESSVSGNLEEERISVSEF